MSNLFVVSDIHGHYKHFEELLTYWNPEDILVILGDLIDRGPQSLQVIEKVIELKQSYGDNVVFVKGNHEDMLLNFLNNPMEKQEHYYMNGGKETMQNLLVHLPTYIREKPYILQANEIKQHYKYQLEFLKLAPVYKTIGNVLFTHAGFNSEFATLEETTERDFIWIRKHYEITNKTSYINVFGHTPLTYIHESNDVWLSDDKRYIAIDGGCYMSGQLNAVLLNQQGELLELYKVQS
ncbi:serine/threonine protein phosphatase [Solibacillus sp. MA9]|uniref:Serine/threonine protein phosphatase n=1 Tax=Solibacillus palustris TaxID=2908203 RepID=A0ABS9UCD2_9BACL|nr:metallophosphoesterase family protein [Solibacillus sp. MA9]MCH7321974.1 serine/threonine protein phosphatase [Solibacillus sp. MA9]